jgi:CheY-like chemotaxis protein
MITTPKALLVEDNALEREALADLVSSRGLLPIAAGSPAQAYRRLQDHPHLSLAIVDWNMAEAGDEEATSAGVLRRLARATGRRGQATPDHPNTLVIVYAAGIGDLRIQDAITLAHPGALVHDKRKGRLSLGSRITELLESQVGDLRLEHGRVVYAPTRQRFAHGIAFDTVLNHPNPVYVPRLSADYSGLWRFQRWLQEQGSMVSVVPSGARDHWYHLVVTESTSSAARGQGRATSTR